MRVTCKHCGRAHPSYECKYRDTKSTAARKDVHLAKADEEAAQKGKLRNSQDHPAGANSAGTQVLPVDTIGPFSAKANLIKVLNQCELPTAEERALAEAVVSRFDKKAWMRSRMPAYMRQYRADVKSGLRVPKPKSSKPIQ